MKHSKWLVAVILVALTGMASAQLSSGSKIVAQVPFEFVVANKIVPAGQCIVSVATMDGRTLAISNASSKVKLFSSTSRAETQANASHYALVFRQYGDRYFLTGIKLEGSKMEYRLPQSKAEAELRARNVSATDETLLASLQ